MTLRGRPNKRPSKPWSPFANSQEARAGENVVAWGWPYLSHNAAKRESAETPPAQWLAAAAEAGRRALADGNYRLALRELNLAAGLRDRNPGLLAPAGDRELAQL